MRKTFKTVLALLLAVFALSAIGEAAATTSVRHRPRHSSRVTTGRIEKKKAKRTKRQAHRTATARHKAPQKNG